MLVQNCKNQGLKVPKHWQIFILFQDLTNNYNLVPLVTVMNRNWEY